MGNNVVTKRCSMCGKPIPLSPRNKKYCSKKCSHDAAIMLGRIYRAERKKIAQTTNRSALSIIKLDTISLIAKAASEQGLSYGEYVARMDGLK